MSPTLPRPFPAIAYHGTNERFECFTLDYAARPGMSENGHLGVWLAFSEADAKSFGTRCLTVELNAQAPYVMPLRELMEMHRACQTECQDLETEAAAREHARTFYGKHRERLVGLDHDLILLLEANGAANIAIGLIPDRLAIL